MTKRRPDDVPTTGYRVMERGSISWPKPGGGWVNADPGEIRTDIPPEHLAAFIEHGDIEPADTGGPPAAEEAR